MKFQTMKSRILEYHCAAHSECPPFDRSPVEGWLVLQITESQDFRKHQADGAWSQAVESLHQSKNRPVMIVLGPNTCTEDAAEFKLLAKAPTKLFLVEANERLNRNLTANLLKYGHLPQNFEIINAAITDQPKKGNLTFYVVDDGREVESSLENYFESNISVSVRSLTPQDLLEELGLTSGVDILHIDLEGYDLRVLPEFFKDQAFQPKIVKFEWLFAAFHKGPGPFEMMPILNLLSSKGYDLHQDAHDMIAIRRDASWVEKDGLRALHA